MRRPPRVTLEPVLKPKYPKHGNEADAGVHRLPVFVAKSGHVRIAVAGAGGNGSQLISKLARMERMLRAKGKPWMFVELYDPEPVTLANIGRQLFYPNEVGLDKSAVLIHRANMAYGTKWRSWGEKYIDQACKWIVPEHGEILLPYDFLITCVDSGNARWEIAQAISESAFPPTYWLDLGNDADSGQVILGQPARLKPHVEDVTVPAFDGPRLPTVVERYPGFYDGSIEETDTPSCSLSEALDRQEPFINDQVATWAARILWNLLAHGQTDTIGCFINMRDFRVNPVKVTPAQKQLEAA